MSFKEQLDALVITLNSCSAHYIRCIKTNAEKRANLFSPIMTYEQLTYSGVMDSVVIMQSGFPCRLTHDAFLQRYLCLVHEKDTKRALISKAKAVPPNAMALCVDLIQAFEADIEFAALLPTSALLVGRSHVLYRPTQQRCLEQHRALIINATVVSIQSWFRACLTRNFCFIGRCVYPQCLQAVVNRDLDQIRELADTLVDVSTRIGSLKGGCPVNAYFELGSAAIELASAIDIISKVTEILQEISRESGVDISTMAGFSDQRVRERAKHQIADLKALNKINFQSQYKVYGDRSCFDLDWQADPYLRSIATVSDTLDEFDALIIDSAEAVEDKDFFLLQECIETFGENRFC